MAEAMAAAARVRHQHRVQHLRAMRQRQRMLTIRSQLERALYNLLRTGALAGAVAASASGGPVSGATLVDAVRRVYGRAEDAVAVRESMLQRRREQIEHRRRHLLRLKKQRLTAAAVGDGGQSSGSNYYMQRPDGYEQLLGLPSWREEFDNDDEDDGEKIKFEVEVTRNRAKYEAPHFAVIKAWKVVPEGEKERKEEFEVPLPPPPPPRTNLERGIEFILPALILLQDVSARDQRRR